MTKPKRVPKAKQRGEPKPTQQSQHPQQLKAQGNAAFKVFKLDEAIELYTRAIAAAPLEPVYSANRSAAFFEAGRYDECIKDVLAVLRMASKDAAAVPQPLQAKLCLRAARSAMWQGHVAQASEWLSHEALRSDEYAAQVATLTSEVRACETLQQQCKKSSAALCAVAAGVDADAPRLVRDCVSFGEHCDTFPSGHDLATSALQGTLCLLPLTT